MTRTRVGDVAAANPRGPSPMPAGERLPDKCARSTRDGGSWSNPDDARGHAFPLGLTASNLARNETPSCPLDASKTTIAAATIGPSAPLRRSAAPVSRRGFIAGAAACFVALAAKPAAAAAATVRNIERSEIGTTFTMDLEHAPFPTSPVSYQDRTVLVFVPNAFRVERGRRVPMLVHFHGHHTTVDKTITAHQLREQLVDSRQNAILIVPQGPVNAADSSAGKLDAPGGLARLLDEALRVLSSNEGKYILGRRPLVPGNVCLSAHSGGFHAAASSARFGGVPINEIYLFDALYADLPIFRDWVLEGRGKPARSRHKLVSYYGAGATEANSQWLLGELKKANVDCAFETVEGTLSREELVHSEAVFVRTQIAHNGVTHELNALRDCLYASGLPRHLHTAWFDTKQGARQIERRR